MALRVRLGAFLIDEPTLCQRCGREVLERTVAPALCCAAPEGTHGHYEVRDKVFSLVQFADPNVSTEVLELRLPFLAPGRRWTLGFAHLTP